MTNRFRVLNASEAIEQIDYYPDVYLTPGYGMASEVAEGGSWRLAVWGDGLILYPFLIRRIPKSTQSEHFDIISPYGYAGVWSFPETPLESWKAFRESFLVWVREHNIVSEFIRVGGLIPGIDALREAWGDVSAKKHNETFAIETGLGYLECWDRFHSRTRTKVRKARKQGFDGEWRKAEFEDVVQHSHFRRLYNETMQRIGASDYYFFPDGYYKFLLKYCQIYILEVVDSEGEIAAAALLMAQGKIAHLHLVGSRVDANRAGVGTLIYDKSTYWAAENGYDLLHIGGGVAPGDSLAYFKQGFGGKPCDYWTVRSVLDREEYSRLTSDHAKDQSYTLDELVSGGFFPAYRQER